MKCQEANKPGKAGKRNKFRWERGQNRTQTGRKTDSIINSQAAIVVQNLHFNALPVQASDLESEHHSAAALEHHYHSSQTGSLDLQ